jgi:UDP-glucose 4-epimerase
MKKVLITGANSYIGTNVENWLKNNPSDFHVDTVDTMNEVWKSSDFSQYDVVFHVAGIAHVDPKPEMAPLYYKVNCDLTVEIAKWAKEHGVKQFIFMSSKIVYQSSKNLEDNIVTLATEPKPNDFYGDSKLKAEQGLNNLACDTFKVANLRPCMIYGPNSKGNFLRLGWLGTKTPVFPAWHNKRSMLYIDNLCEFVKQIITHELGGTFYPQNAELADTVEIVRFFAKKHNHCIWISKIFNPAVWIGSKFLKPVCKMFASSYYEPSMSKYDFEYQIVSFEDSLKNLTIRKSMK